MEQIAVWFASTLGKYVSAEVVVFLISMMPVLELRGGLLASSMLGVPITTAIPICIVGNIIPIPFLLFFIRKIFKCLKNVPVLGKLVWKLENRAMKKSDSIKKGEFWGLALFVGIPLPGTGAWTGSIIAALLEIDPKKAVVSMLIGIAMATVIMAFLSYGLLGALM